jgi:hypothetical protein
MLPNLEIRIENGLMIDAELGGLIKADDLVNDEVWTWTMLRGLNESAEDFERRIRAGERMVSATAELASARMSGSGRQQRVGRLLRRLVWPRCSAMAAAAECGGEVQRWSSGRALSGALSPVAMRCS